MFYKHIFNIAILILYIIIGIESNCQAEILTAVASSLEICQRFINLNILPLVKAIPR